MVSKTISNSEEATVTTTMLWPSPTLTVQHRNTLRLNAALARLILQKEREILAKGKATSVAGVTDGLTSHWLEYNVLLWNHPEVLELRAMILSGLRQFFALLGNPDDERFRIAGISCWANVLRYGECLRVHHHDPAFVSAHYQVQSGTDGLDTDVGGSGHTVYFRPGFVDRSHGGKAAGPTSPWDSDWLIDAPPVEGKLFFFPSYIRHEVRPYMGNTQRISIALDVYVQQQEAPIYFSPPRWFVP